MCFLLGDSKTWMKLRLGCLHPLILRFSSLFRVAHSGTGMEKEGCLSLFFLFLFFSFTVPKAAAPGPPGLAG